MYYNRISIILLIVFVTFLSGCQTSDTYRKQVSIPNNSWHKDFVPQFKIEVDDTSSIYFSSLLLRHDDAYDYSNLWVRILIQRPGDTSFTDSFQVELKLADELGNWLGLNQGGNWNHRIVFQNKLLSKFHQKGEYVFGVRQLMRTESLNSVMNVGWQLEKRK